MFHDSAWAVACANCPRFAAFRQSLLGQRLRVLVVVLALSHKSWATSQKWACPSVPLKMNRWYYSVSRAGVPNLGHERTTNDFSDHLGLLDFDRCALSALWYPSEGPMRTLFILAATAWALYRYDALGVTLCVWLLWNVRNSSAQYTGTVL